MQIDWIHHSDDGPDTLNLCFNALDRHVVRGRADEPAIAADRPTSYARLVEEVAAFGGVLRAFGIGLGDPSWPGCRRAGTPWSPCSPRPAWVPSTCSRSPRVTRRPS